MLIFTIYQSDLVTHTHTHIYVCMHAKLLQSCPTLCNPMDYSPPGSSAHRILQARILQWVAIAFSSMYIDVHTHTHTHTSFLNTLFHYDLSQDIEHCSLCYIVGPCCSSILNIKAFNCSPQLLTPFPPNSSPLATKLPCWSF